MLRLLDTLAAWLCRLMGLCLHPHDLRVREDDGSLSFVCARCGRKVPAFARTEAERQQMAAKFPPAVATKAVLVPKIQEPAPNVTAFPARKGKQR